MAVPGAWLGIEPLADADPAGIAGYRLLGRLGAGGMGRVYLGLSPGSRLAAVKLVHEEYAADPAFRARFRLEARAARSVSGAFTAPVLEADPEAERPWLAVLYTPALTLHEAVARFGPLPAAAVRSLGAALAEALSSIHGAGLVHRDLKPGNVLLTSAGPLVIDFGISRALDGTRITRTGTVVGTVGYMAPEQLRSGGPPGASGDVFALGCVLGFAATGVPPFGAGRPEEVARRVVREEPALERVPAELRPLIAGCLAKDPLDRPRTAQILDRLAPVDLRPLIPDALVQAVAERGRAADALAAAALAEPAALAEAPVTALPAPAGLAPPAAPARPYSRRRVLLLAGGAGAAAVGGGLLLAEASEGSAGGLSGLRPTWTAMAASAAPSSSTGAAKNAYPLGALGLVQGTVVMQDSMSATAFASATGTVLWTWNSSATDLSGPQVSGSIETLPCGFGPAGLCGWAILGAATQNNTFFTTSASGAVTGSWSVDDTTAAETLHFCAQSGGVAVFGQRDIVEAGVYRLDQYTAFDLQTAALAWTYTPTNIGSGLAFYTSSAAADADHVYVQDGPDTYALKPSDGSVIWRNAATAAADLPTQLVLAAGTLLVGSSRVTALNPENGRVLWQSSNDSGTAAGVAAQATSNLWPYFNMISVVAGVVYLCNGSGSVRTFDLADGSAGWTYAGQGARLITSGGYPPPGGFASSRVVAVPVGGGSAPSFAALDPGTGRLLDSYALPEQPGADSSAPLQLAVAGQSVYAARGDLICAYEGAS